MESGLDLEETATIAAKFEYIVRKHTLVLLKAAYGAQDLSMEDAASSTEVTKVVDNYMAVWILGLLVQTMVGEAQHLTPAIVRDLRSNVTSLYPAFTDTQGFLRDLQ